jgi:hypothetical protein
MSIKTYGIDVGTYNLCLAKRNEDNKVEIKREINAFFTIPIENNFMVNMLKKAGAPMIEVGGFIYVLGKNAIDLALSMGKEFQRPMKNGILSINEKDAFNILAVMIRSMIGKLEADNTIVYYSIPADAINTKTNVQYHTKVIQSILDKYIIDNKTIKAFPINEALCIIMSELAEQQYTGIAISFGAGMVNTCFSLYSVPVVQFSLTNAGDYVDDSAAQSCGETSAYINSEKEKIDLSKDPQNSIERAIQYHYEIMIENSLKGIREGIIKAGTKANPGKPIDIVVAGGTSTAKGFVDFFIKTFNKNTFPIEVREIRAASDPLYAVANGALVAAEAHQDK